MRTQETIEGELERILELKRANPDMRLYYEALQDKLRMELRANIGIQEKDNSVFYFVSGIFLVLACISGLAVYL